jgi:uncharacterized coiled-coil DUF342 family protein
VNQISDIKAQVIPEDAKELADVSAQVNKLLAGRRGLHSQVNEARLISTSADTKMSELFSLLMSRKKDIRSKLIAIENLLNADDMREFTVGENESNSKNTACLQLCMSTPLTDGDSGGPLRDSRLNECDKVINRQDRMNEDPVEVSDINVLSALHKIHYSLDQKLKELSKSNSTSSEEITRLHAIITESQEQVTDQRHEISSLRNELKGSRIDLARLPKKMAEGDA